MTQKIASILALLAFAVSLALGIEADNTFATTLSRALLAMACTFGIGLVVGAMAQKMLDENIEAEQKKLQNSETKLQPRDR